jgi:hypothetical protein
MDIKMVARRADICLCWCGPTIPLQKRTSFVSHSRAKLCSCARAIKGVVEMEKHLRVR